MSDKKRKMQRRLGRKCPECGGELDFVALNTIKDGVLYSEKIIECQDCDYLEKYHISNKKYKDELFNPKW
jgi:hypothetical protein